LASRNEERRQHLLHDRKVYEEEGTSEDYDVKQPRFPPSNNIVEGKEGKAKSKVVDSDSHSKSSSTWTMERLFPSNAVAKRKTGFTGYRKGSVFATSPKGIGQKPKKVILNELDKKLHLASEKVAIRSAGIDAKFSVSSPPYDVSDHNIMEYSCEFLKIPHGQQVFREYFLHPLSIKMLGNIFWFIQIKIFKPTLAAETLHLKRQTAASYVGLIDVCKNHKDFFFKYFPVAMGTSVCLAFHYLCPASRHMYTEAFKEFIYYAVYELLTGMDVCKITINSIRKACYPVREGKSVLPEVEAQKQVAGKNKPANSYLPEINSAGGSSKGGIRLRQARSSFDPTKVNDLMLRYIGVDSTPKKASSVIKRTTPVPTCRVGGVNTFQRTHVESDMHKEIYSTYHQHKSVTLDQEGDLAVSLSKEIKNVEKSRLKLEEGGVAGVSRFCNDIINFTGEEKRRAEQLEKEMVLNGLIVKDILSEM
jgi:hypothetical protein